jgi:hypothetical protein
MSSLKPWIKPNATKKFDTTTVGKQQFDVAYRIARRHFNDVRPEFRGYTTLLHTGSKKHE